MTCNIVFDFCSPHNGEYWYRCETCGASKWFAYGQTPRKDAPIDACVEQTIALLDVTTKKLVLHAYKNGYADATARLLKIANESSSTTTIEQALKL